MLLLQFIDRDPSLTQGDRVFHMAQLKQCLPLVWWQIRTDPVSVRYLNGSQIGEHLGSPLLYKQDTVPTGTIRLITTNEHGNISV